MPRDATNPMAKYLIFSGICLIVFGLAIWLGERFNIPIGRLPGDFEFKTGNTTIYIPLTTGLIASLILSGLSYLWYWLSRR